MCHTFPREPSPIARKEPDCSPADLRNTPDLQQLQESKHQQRTKALQLPAAMLALSLFTLGLLSAVAPASCQQGLGKLQPWMQGLIAVAVFLVLVAVAFAINHFWCQEEP
ncbi:hypothetical protein U0070_008812 [Myodes glareolus]|uniref:PDZK1-interacting protein 1 n=2 Tax=Myodes glareolus TaxID=447135 RepID=A0AAW0IIU3_MYOGA